MNVIYGSQKGLHPFLSEHNQVWSQDSPSILGSSESQGRLGYALISGDFNGDGYSDLAIGVSQEHFQGITRAGRVQVIYGSPAGLHAYKVLRNQIWHQNAVGILDRAEKNDRFGEQLASGDFNADGYSDLVVGSLYEDESTSQDNSGIVHIIYGSEEGLHAERAIQNQIWMQSSSGILGTSQGSDNFATVLSTGDYNQDGYTDLAIGTPGDKVSTNRNVGSVNVIYGSLEGLHASLTTNNQLWHQGSHGIIGTLQPNTFFEKSLTSGDLNDDGNVDLVIGVNVIVTSTDYIPEVVHVIYGSTRGLHRDLAEQNQAWHQDAPGILGHTESTFDGFGTTLSSGNSNH